MGVGRDLSKFSLGFIKLKTPREYLDDMFARHWICTSETQGKGQCKTRVIIITEVS